jgi:hypothetical protein
MDFLADPAKSLVLGVELRSDGPKGQESLARV